MTLTESQMAEIQKVIDDGKIEDYSNNEEYAWLLYRPDPCKPATAKVVHEYEWNDAIVFETIPQNTDGQRTSFYAAAESPEALRWFFATWCWNGYKAPEHWNDIENY